MPSFAKALPYLLLLSALTTWPITTNITAHPRFLSDGGRSNRQQRRTGKNKNSKKQNAVEQCTVDQFVGDYKYVNCQDVATKVRIACDKDDRTKKPCNYTEAPLKNDTNDGCVVQGSFGATHIMKDPANPGVCQLNFVALKDSCKATTNALPSGFGMRAEVDMTAGHADTSTSTLVLWFSNDGGVVYYNEDEPQEAVFLHQDLPSRRKLGGCECEYVHFTEIKGLLSSSQCGEVVQKDTGDPFCFDTEMARVVLGGRFPGITYQSERGTCAEAGKTKWIKTIQRDGGSSFGTFFIMIFE